MNKYLEKLAALSSKSYPELAAKLGLGKLPNVQDLPEELKLKGVNLGLNVKYLGKLLRLKERRNPSRFPKSMIKEW